ncbi:MAG: zf-HC2 domain-containing protein [Candidatus Zixiibacteriota bacterium]
MNCRQALKHLYDVIDKEANEVDVKEVERHLKMCRHCMAQYEFEKAFKAVVQEKGSNPGDVDKVKDSIMAKLDAIDAAGEVGPTRTPFKWHLVAMASAAVIVLCIIAAVSLSGPGETPQTASNDTPAATAPSTDDPIPHFIMAHMAHSNGNGEKDTHTDPLKYLYEQTGILLDKSPKFPVENILSVSVDTILGVQFGCLEMLNNHGELVTVFLTTSDKYDLPANPVAMVDGREMVVHRCEKCTLVGMEKKDLIYMVVSDPKCEPKELAEVASFF